MIARGVGPRGGEVDLTSKVAWRAEPAGIVVVDAQGALRPLGPGVATVRATLGDEEATSRVTVLSGRERSWDFAQDVVPILSRAGCNAGACHGKADGQNGFHLSLFGYDPAGDYQSVTRESGARRLSRLDPEKSLLLLKATGRVPHGGGPRLESTSEDYRTLVAWIKAGAPEKQGTTHGGLAGLVVEPANIRLDEPGPQQLRVEARYADGHRRDVTRLAIFRALDESAASVDPRGRAVLLRRAETDLIVRYQSQVRERPAGEPDQSRPAGGPRGPVPPQLHR